MSERSKCGHCGASDFETNLERVGDLVWLCFVRCKACKVAVGVTTAESAPAMLHDVLKGLKEQGEKVSAIVEALEAR